MSEIMLKLDGVNYAYHTRSGETPAMQNFNMEVNEGEFYGIVGPSGSGKTTLLSLIAGILHPSGGTMQRKAADAEVGYMLQRDHLFEWRSIKDNITLGLELRKQKSPENLAYADELLAKYHLDAFAAKHPSELSGGMRQRVALIRTLVLKPKIILLDEPFSALDFQTRLAVADDVRRIIKNERITAVLVTHDISEAIALCSRVAVLSARPATVKRVFDITIDENLSSLERREDAMFATLFHNVWKELEFKDE